MDGREQEIDIDVVGTSTFDGFPKISAAKTYNMILSGNFLESTPGRKKLADIESSIGATGGVGRGFFHSVRGNLAMAVVGRGLYVVDATEGITFAGNLNTVSGFVYMDENLNSQIGIVDGLNLYIYNRETKTLTTQIILPDLVPNYIKFHDTYFLIGNGTKTSNGSKFYAYKHLNDNNVEIAYELAFQLKPDYALLASPLPGGGSYILVLGKSCGQLQNNVGGLQGYSPLSTLSIDYGIASLATYAASDTFCCWLSVNQTNAPVIIMFDGKKAQTISTDGINDFLLTLNRPDKSFAYFYKIKGHLVYKISFFDEDDNLTLFYDFTVGRFCHASDYNLDYDPMLYPIYMNNKVYCLSTKNSGLYEISPKYKTYDDNIVKESSPFYVDDRNNVIPRIRITSNFRLKKTQPFIARRFIFTVLQGEEPGWSKLGDGLSGITYITTEDGIQLQSEDGIPIVTEDSKPFMNYKPVIDYSFSMDSGYTFSNELRITMNYIGNRYNTVQFLQMGRMNEYTAKIKFWCKSDVVMGGGVLEILS